MKTFKLLFRYLICLPNDLLAWLWLLVAYLLWGNKPFWNNGFWFEFKSGSWPMRTWFKTWGATTFGHGGWLAPGRAGTNTERHEQVHVEQYEVAGFCGFLVFFTALIWAPQDWLFGLVYWTVLPVWLELTGFAVAWLRGEKSYRGSVNEEAAYSIAQGVFVYNGVPYAIPVTGFTGSLNETGVTAFNPVLGEVKLFPIDEQLPEGYISIFEVVPYTEEEKPNA